MVLACDKLLISGLSDALSASGTHLYLPYYCLLLLLFIFIGYICMAYVCRRYSECGVICIYLCVVCVVCICLCVYMYSMCDMYVYEVSV